MISVIRAKTAMVAAVRLSALTVMRTGEPVAAHGLDDHNRRLLPASTRTLSPPRASLPPLHQ